MNCDTPPAACARRADITQFTALMSGENRRSRRLLGKIGRITQRVRDGATTTYRVDLRAPAP